MFKEYSEKNHTELPTLTIIQGGGTVKREDSDRNLMYNESNLSNYKMVRKDDFIVHLRSFEGGLEKSSLDGIISPAYHTFHSDVADTGFYYPYFQSHEFIKHKLVPHVYGIRDGRSIDIGGMKTIEIPYTSMVEQRKIGDYLESLDQLITLHQRKYRSLRKTIWYAWEQRKFSDYYKMSSGYAFKMSDYCDEGASLINGESIQHGIINDNNLKYLPEKFIQQYPDFILKEGDIVVGLNRPITNGNLKIARIPTKYNDSLLYQRAGKIVYKTDCDKDFTYILLSQEILKHTLVAAVGSDQPFISTSKLDKWEMMMPAEMEEQIKIGKYFSHLEHLITLHQRELFYGKKCTKSYKII